MQFIADQLAGLERLDVAPAKPADFDAFWNGNCRLAQETPLDIRGGRIDYPFPGCEVRDLTFAGLDGTRIHTWLLLPPGARQGPVPAVVHLHGASGSRGVPSSHAAWLLAGAAVVAMDFRLQDGLTGSVTGFTAGHELNWASMGILDRDTYYFRHTWIDALRSIRLALETPEIDARRVAVAGGSQGGGAALAMAALDPRVALCLADVPSMCWLQKRVYDRTGGSKATAEFLRSHPDQLERVCATLSYFDNLHLADRIRCPVLVSCGLKDPVCPPDCVYAVYNRITAPKQMCAYPFGEHGGGGAAHEIVRLQFLRKHFFGGAEG
jgi:cephalosporin-C deacetylase